MVCFRPAILTLTLALLATRASACILEFRSTDWQVAQSPLVIVATVTHVTPEPLTPELTALFADGLTKPSTATVTINQILKGSSQSKTLKVSSGPIRSCNPYPVHLDFTQGKTYIFILTSKSDSSDDVYQLAWAGSLQELSALPAVQDSIARCAADRSDYLARQSADTLTAAKALDAQLTAASKSWPIRSEDSLTPSELLHGISDDPATKSALATLLATLDNSTPAIIQTALALDFNRPSTEGGWSRHPLWSQARIRYTDAHPKELLALQQAEWSRLLASTSTTPEQLQKYFARITEADQHPLLAFPIPLPDPLPHLRGDTLTTDFLLRSAAFDRGDIYFNFGMQPDPLSTLNSARLQSLLPALYENSNTHLQWAAATALAEIPTNDFLPLLLPHFIAGDPFPLTDIQPDTLPEKHLLALLDYAASHSSPSDQAKIWTRLTTAQVFTPAILQRATLTTKDSTLQSTLASYQTAAAAYQKSSHSPFDSP